MKRKIILAIDILTAILFAIQIQSTVVFIFEEYSYLQNYFWNEFFIFYRSYGLSSLGYSFQSELIYYQFLFIVFCLNLYVIVIKMICMYKKETMYGMHRALLFVNIAFICAKIVEFDMFWTAAMGI
ncbi:hypothetical protein [Filifactor alocis]